MQHVVRNVKRARNNNWSTIGAQISAINKIGHYLQVKELDGWYNATGEDISAHGGSGLIRAKYRDSLSACLQTVYPAHNWQLWRFTYTPKRFSKDINGKRKAIDYVGRVLGIKQLSDWYTVTNDRAMKAGGRNILVRYNRSLYECLQDLHPEYEWDPIKFVSTPGSYWKDSYNKHRVCDSIAESLGVKKLDDWYTVTTTQFSTRGGALLNAYGDSMPSLLRSVFPSHEWKPWRFSCVTPGFWNSLENQRLALEDFSDHQYLDLKCLDDWYNVTVTQIHSLHGSSILSAHSNSLLICLQAVFPEHKWKPWRFKCAPMGFWDDVRNHKKAFEDVSEALDIHDFDMWRKMSPNDFSRTGLKSFVIRHYGSLTSALNFLFPHFNIGSMISKRKTHMKFLERVSRHLNIRNMDSWYRVSYEQMAAHGGSRFMKYFPHMLGVKYPNYKWQWRKFRIASKKAKQRIMLHCLAEIFYNDEIIEEHVIGFKNLTGEYITVDAFVTSKNIAVEYQGEQHYHDMVFPEGMWVTSREALDAEKMQQCKDSGIRLVHVPYWWDCTVGSLRSILSKSSLGILAKDNELNSASQSLHASLMAPHSLAND